MKIVSVSHPMIGRQFNPYLRASVLADNISTSGRREYELWGQDPLRVDPDHLPKETWDVWEKFQSN